MPVPSDTVFTVDRASVVRYTCVGWQQRQIPSVRDTLRELDALGG